MEEDIGLFIFAVIAALIMIGGLLILTWQLLTNTFDLVLFSLLGRNPFKYFAFRYKTLPPSQVRLLESFPYFRSMPAALRKIFIHRVADFIEKKKFVAGEGLTLQDEMKTLIAASAVQLTFGMTYYKFRGYDSILIFPEAYFSPQTGKYHLGEVNPKGAIVFSWPHFVKGYDIPDDNRNLGLHEFAHALFLNKISGRDEDLRLGFYYREFQEAGHREYFRMKKEKKGYLREYAASNMAEFFSVCVEHFFEAPNAMKRELPGLYAALAKVLGQDPSKWMKL